MDYDLPDDMKTLREMARKFAGEVIAVQGSSHANCGQTDSQTDSQTP